MKVYKNTRTRGYSGGMILVAANSVKEAIETFHNDERFDWMSMHVIQDDFSGNEIPYWDEFVYKTETWQEMPMLTANVDKPQVIAEEGYSE